MNRNDTIDFAGADRITRATNYAARASSLSGPARITETHIWPENNQNQSTLASRVEALVDGTASARSAYGLTNLVQRSCGATCQSINSAPDGSCTVTIKIGGCLDNVTRYDAKHAARPPDLRV